MSRIIEKLTAPVPDPVPDKLPPAMYPLPSNVPATPNTVMQTYGTQGDSAQFLPLLIEIYNDAKAIFKRNPVDVFSSGTGGSQFATTGATAWRRPSSALANNCTASTCSATAPATNWRAASIGSRST